MRLSKQTKDAVNTLVHLARSDGRLVSVPEIARACGMTEATAFKLVPLLVKANLLQTERGRGGGVRLQRDPAEISVGEVVRAVEALQRSTGDGPNDLGRLVDDAFEAFLEILDENTIADMAYSKLESPDSVSDAANDR